MTPSSTAPPDKDELGHAIHGLLRSSLTRSGSRSEQRYPLSMSIRATPLDSLKRPIGPEIELLTRDISDSGIGVLAPTMIHEQYLLLAIPTEAREFHVIVEVQWREKLGGGAYHRLGARFLTT